MPRKALGMTSPIIDILFALKGEDSHDTVPLGWDGYGL
jgi:hypothetical protein